MRSYGKVSPSFWRRGSGKNLRGKPEAQVLALYLMTCEQGTMCGIFHCLLVTIAGETGLSPDATRSAFELLADEDLAYIDEPGELVFVPATALHQVGPELKGGDKRRVAIVNELTRAGAHPFVADFWRRYGDAYSLGPVPRALQPLDAPSKGHHEVASTPSDATITITNTNRALTKHSAPMVLQTAPDAVVQSKPEPEPKTKQAKRGSRAARSLIPDSWHPSPETIEALHADRLDADRIADDFKDYWRAEGKMMADWDAAFRNNVSRIQTRDDLRRRYTRVVPVPLRSEAKPEPMRGPPVPPPPGALEALRRFSRGQTEHLEIPDPEATDESDEPSDEAAS